MPKKPDISDEEKALFQQATHGIKPLAHSKINPTPKKVTPRKKVREENQPDSFPFSDFEKTTPVSGDEIISFSRPGIQHKMLRKLRQGQYNVEAILDLHGKTVIEARETLSQFLSQCSNKGCRHILIIHGKGHTKLKPILKNMLNNWLRQTDQVLAFYSAQPKDGRGGALYVLLRR